MNDMTPKMPRIPEFDDVETIRPVTLLLHHDECRLGHVVGTEQMDRDDRFEEIRRHRSEGLVS